MLFCARIYVLQHFFATYLETHHNFDGMWPECSFEVWIVCLSRDDRNVIICPWSPASDASSLLFASPWARSSYHQQRPRRRASKIQRWCRQFILHPSLLIRCHQPPQGGLVTVQEEVTRRPALHACVREWCTCSALG